MKLAQLLLHAFGPFTDTVLDFAAGPANLHLIYGPNEAGKSSALRAMTDLRFGIPLRSPDDFIHASNQLRIAGVFFDDEGERLALVRRKGRGATLSRCPVATTTEPDPNLPVLREHEQALTGGLERSEFEAMFGLNHARLREGGNLLLRGEGELGSALFEASAGTRGISAMLSALESDAKQLYNPHGRAHHAVINEARRQLDEQRQIWKQSQTRPADWQALYRAHETAQEKLDDVERALETKRRLDNKLTEWRTVEPLLREHDRVLAELDAMADIPELPATAREERLGAEQAMRHARDHLQQAENEITRCTRTLDSLILEPALLDHAEAIERLAAGTEAAARSRIEVQKEQAVIGRIADELTVSATRIAPGRSVQDILDALPSEADRRSLQAHLEESGRLRERLEGYQRQADALEHGLKRGEADAVVLPDPVARQAMALALRKAQALGDVARQTEDLNRQIHEFENHLQQSLSDLGLQSVDTLKVARPLPESEIAATRQALGDIGDALRALRDEETRIQRDLEAQRLRQRQLAAEGEVVTADTLRLARERRDEAWALIRRYCLETRSGGAEPSHASSPQGALPEAFEAAQREADRQADLLRADARRAAGFEECSARIEQMLQRREEIAGETQVQGAREQALRADWSKRLVQSGLPELTPDALREWLGQRQQALSMADRLAALQLDRDSVLAEATTTASDLAKALRAAGQTVASEKALSYLIEQAAAWQKATTEADAKREDRIAVGRIQQAELDKTRALIAETQTALRYHAAGIHAWHTRLLLANDSPPEAVKARVEELEALTRLSAALGDARLRQAHHRAVIDDLADQAARLASLLREPPPEPVDDFADRLRKRLARAREQDQMRSSLERELARALQQQRQALQVIRTQTTVLEQLCAAAGVAAADGLPEREERAAHKRAARQTVQMLRQRLAEASARPETSLREGLAGRDVIAIEGERERCRAEIASLELSQASGRQEEERTRRALEAVDESDRAARAREAMESAAARYRTALRPWARLRLAHALLSEALNRFRERAQAPMVAAASTYFALMTGGRYERLVADEEDDKPILRAERADGIRIGVDAMSEGTADQLYLALRLAALDLRRASHPPMPLVLDDVLITSDDERAASILRALARFSKQGQVMLFTHHRHLLDIALSVLDDRTLAIHNL